MKKMRASCANSGELFCFLCFCPSVHMSLNQNVIISSNVQMRLSVVVTETKIVALADGDYSWPSLLVGSALWLN